ncbi:chlorohydrolase [Streptococcus pneumoniae]|nr:chlorohydrolase [Streptococcus pneumoniae]TVX02713.1 chlorohydrolase [Streptococcus pneumoniae]
MKIKDQTRKLATGCSKQCFEVVDSFLVYSLIFIEY